MAHVASIVSGFHGLLAKPYGIPRGFAFGDAAVFGGLTDGTINNVSLFSYATETFTASSSFINGNLSQRWAARIHPQVYFGGGNDGSVRAFVERYNVVTTVMQSRTALAAVTQNGSSNGAWSDGVDTIGYTQSSAPQSARRYAAASGVTSSATALSSTRTVCAMTGSPTTAFIKGGLIGLTMQDASENYTLATGTLTAGTLLGVPRSQMAARSNASNKMYFSGGFDPGSGEFANCFRFDIPSDTRTNITALSVVQSGAQGVGNATTAFFVMQLRTINRYAFATDVRTTGAVAPNISNAMGAA